MADRQLTLKTITSALLDCIGSDERRDLQTEQPDAAVELYFAPVGLQALPTRSITSGDCSVDGIYDPFFDPARPWIFYAGDVNERRIRFTILHELGHHLFATRAAALLDDIDRLGNSSEDSVRAEEVICHRFSGHILVPEEQLREMIGIGPVLPDHIRQLHETCSASWEAIAVRVAETMSGRGAVAILRDNSLISFCASSPTLGWSWWPRGSRVDPNGPLASALSVRQRARPDTYRFGLGYPQAMFCDTLPIHDRLAIAVLSDKPSDGSLSIIEEAEPAWKDRVEFCEWHPGVERDIGWCARCSGRRCPECGRCGCYRPVNNPLCPGCGLLKPFRPGATICRDCEEDRR